MPRCKNVCRTAPWGHRRAVFPPAPPSNEDPPEAGEKVLIKCQKCPAQLKKKNLPRHLAEVHGKSQRAPFQCEHCKYSTHRGWDLRRHQRRCHSELAGMVTAAPQEEAPPVIVMPSMQGGRPRELPRPFPRREPVAGGSGWRPVSSQSTPDVAQSPEPVFTFSAPAAPAPATAPLSPESLDLDPPLSEFFSEEAPMLDEEPGDLAEVPRAGSSSEAATPQAEESGQKKEVGGEFEMKTAPVQEETVPETAPAKKKTAPVQEETLPETARAQEDSTPVKPEPADITLQRQKLESLSLSVDDPMEDIGASLDSILKRPRGLAGLRFELERRGYSLFSGAELRQLKLDVRKRVEAETREDNAVELSAKDKIQATWKSAKPAALAAEPDDEGWMAQPQQLTIGGKVLTFDLRVRSKDIDIPAIKPRRRKAAVKKEVINVPVDNKGEAADSPIVLE